MMESAAEKYWQIVEFSKLFNIAINNAATIAASVIIINTINTATGSTALALCVADIIAIVAGITISVAAVRDAESTITAITATVLLFFLIKTDSLDSIEAINSNRMKINRQFFSEPISIEEKQSLAKVGREIMKMLQIISLSLFIKVLSVYSLRL